MAMPTESDVRALIAAKTQWLRSFPWKWLDSDPAEHPALDRLVEFLLLDEVCAKQLRPEEDLDWPGFLDWGDRGTHTLIP